MSCTIVIVLCAVLAFFAVHVCLSEIKISHCRKVYLKTHHLDDLHLPSVVFFIFRRFADIIISALVCLSILPILFVTLAPLIRLTSKGSVIFRQDRVGLFGKKFVCYKFRTMYAGADSSMAKVNDVRVTPIGRILRKTHIDEFMQFFNILKGDMSLIGPRPYTLEVVRKLQGFSNWPKRLIVRPGLSGLAQISSPRTMTADEVLNCDLTYLEKMSLKKDIFIFFETLKFKDVSY